MCWCSANKAKHLSISPPAFFFFFITPSSPSSILSLSFSTPIFSGEMKDRHRASRGQALAQLSNHYLSSPLFSPPFLWQVICQQAAGSGLSIRAVAPEYFSVHTHIHTLFHASPGPDTLLPLVRRMRVRVGGGGINAASSMHHLSHRCPLFNELVWLQLLLLFSSTLLIPRSADRFHLFTPLVCVKKSFSRLADSSLRLPLCLGGDTSHVLDCSGYLEELVLYLSHLTVWNIIILLHCKSVVNRQKWKYMHKYQNILLKFSRKHCTLYPTTIIWCL